MFLRQVDVFAAYVAYSDNEIGRVIQEVEDQGKLDNTLVIYIEGDNGNSAEGTLLGTPNEVAMLNGVMVPVEDQLKYFYDVWGSDKTYNHMAVGWTWVFDTPFSWTKQIASHFGGTKQGMAISWPARIKDKGGIRFQFHHRQVQCEGALPAPHTVLRDDGRPRHLPRRLDCEHEGLRPPWDVLGPVSQDPASFPYELYDLSKDWTQYENVAAKYPAKLKEMEKLFWTEAAKYQVLPLDATMATRAIAPRPSLTAGRNTFTWSGEITGTPNGDAPFILDASYNFKAEVEIPEGGAEGMIVTQGGRFGGYGFYLLKGKPIFLWNLVELKRVRWEGPEALSPGKHTLEFDFRYDGLGMGTLAFNNLSGIGRGGTGVLKVDGKEVANQKMERTLPIILQFDENFDIGADTGTPVSDEDYQVPFRFTGKLDKLTLTIDRPQLTPEDVKKLMETQRENKASE